MRGTRCVNNRINAKVGDDDVALVEGAQAGLTSHSYEVDPVSDKEHRIRGSMPWPRHGAGGALSRSHNPCAVHSPGTIL